VIDLSGKLDRKG